MGPDRVHFGHSGLPKAPILFENWFRYKSHFLLNDIFIKNLNV